MTVGFENHNHSHCIADGIQAAEAYCADHKLRFTPVRRRVYEILLEEHSALGAYEILDRLRENDRKAQPPVAYRALEFLRENGFVHKIERLNAFIACAHPAERHKPAFLICRECDTVAETHAELSEGQLGKAAKEAGFEIEKTVVEAIGVCPSCKDAL